MTFGQCPVDSQNLIILLDFYLFSFSIDFILFFNLVKGIKPMIQNCSQV